MDPVTLNSILFATRLLQLGLFKLIRLGNLNYENILSEGCSRRFFIYKYIKIIFFIFKKFIFNIKISKKSKNIKNNNLKLKKS
jgi:hypothetical protein